MMTISERASRRVETHLIPSHRSGRLLLLLIFVPVLVVGWRGAAAMILATARDLAASMDLRLAQGIGGGAMAAVARERLHPLECSRSSSLWLWLGSGLCEGVAAGAEERARPFAIAPAAGARR